MRDACGRRDFRAGRCCSVLNVDVSGTVGLWGLCKLHFGILRGLNDEKEPGLNDGKGFLMGRL